MICEEVLKLATKIDLKHSFVYHGPVSLFISRNQLYETAGARYFDLLPHIYVLTIYVQTFKTFILHPCFCIHVKSCVF